MTMAIRDMMHGNPNLVDAGWAEEALGFNAIAAGFQVSGSGPTNIPTRMSPRRYSTVRSTGTAYAGRSRSPPKTTA